LHTAVFAQREAPVASTHNCWFAAVAVKVHWYWAGEVLHSICLSVVI